MQHHLKVGLPRRTDEEGAGRDFGTVGVMRYTGLYLCCPAAVGGAEAQGGGEALAVAVELLETEGLEEGGLVEVEAAVVVVGAEEDGEEREAQAGGK